MPAIHIAAMAVGNAGVVHTLRVGEERLHIALQAPLIPLERAPVGGPFVDDWLELGQMGPVAILARAIIPTLGTDRFFELW